MVDIFLDIAPRPLSYLPKWYPYMVRFPEVWGMGYRISNGSQRAKLIVESAYPYVRRTMHKVINRNPADMIVSVHPLANDPFLHALGKNHPPFITVVTDLVTGSEVTVRELYAGGIKVMTSATRQVSHEAVDPRIKSLNYLNNILAKIDAQQAGAHEAIMLNAEGFIAVFPTALVHCYKEDENGAVRPKDGDGNVEAWDGDTFGDTHFHRIPQISGFSQCRRRHVGDTCPFFRRRDYEHRTQRTGGQSRNRFYHFGPYSIRRLSSAD